MPASKHSYPVDVGLFRIHAVMNVTHALPELTEQPGRLNRRPAEFGLLVIPVHKYSLLMKVTADRQSFEIIHNMLSRTPPCYPVFTRYKSRYV